ncbi:MAG: argininosuccinate lyase [Oligoflexus sp.]|jgi:argininosuccinate lyase
MTSLWGGRFSEKQDDFFFAFNESFSFDRRLAVVDIVGSMAYARGLERAGLFTSIELQEVLAGLEELQKRVETDPSFIEQGLRDHYEDVHSFVEFELTKRVGVLGKKLHTGRSRNDQVATDLRLYLRDAIDATLASIRGLQRSLVTKASQFPKLTMPGYTHLQKAQPILFAHYLLAYFEMLQRDAARLIDTRKRVNILPLGSGALSGNSVGVDRKYLAEILGFDGVTANSLDATSDRDFVVEFMGAASLCMVHLSRMAEDLIIYCTDEFQFVRMGDAVSTGSSLMPQKKNPDALELIRGKTGRVIGQQVALLTTLKGLPMCYNKDLQEDKEALFDSLDTVQSCLRVMSLVIDTMQVNEGRVQQEAHKGYMNATDLADYFVAKGVPFREAHHLVGEIVVHAIKKGVSLGELSLKDYLSFSPLVEVDVYQALDMEAVLKKKSSLGGTDPQKVGAAVESARRGLGMN